jgi:hypothetical protein
MRVSTPISLGPTRFRVYLSRMPDFELREVLACPRVDEVPIPSTPSFNCECEQCGARVWVAYSSPIEPIRMCVACSAAHDDRIQQHTEQTDARRSSRVKSSWH